jgi:hypothetical protein
MSTKTRTETGRIRSAESDPRNRDRWSEADVFPITIEEISLSAFGDKRVGELVAEMTRSDHPKVYFLRHGKTVYAMVQPVNFLHLLDIKELLDDDVQFQLAPTILEGL